MIFKIFLLFVFLLGILTQNVFLSQGRIKENQLSLNKEFISTNSKYYFSLRNNIVAAGLSTNAQGFRDEIDFKDKIEKSKNHFKIVLIGSSGLFGFSLDYKSSLTPQIESLFSRKGIQVSVFNLSSIGYQIVQGRLLAEEWLPKIKPDLVILNFGFVEHAGCPALFSDQEIFNLVHKWHLYKLPISLNGLYRLSTISCHGRNNPQSLLWQQRVSAQEYIEEIVILRNILSSVKSNVEIWVIPQTISQKSNLWDQKTTESFINFRNEVEKSEVYEQVGFRYLAKIKGQTDLKYYTADGNHPNAEGTRALLQSFENDLEEYIKLRVRTEH